ncbi:hypothetical protein BE20_07230 [Sorangium cellulosum]|nr:hypothetical protein BE20_07230 [Sorangium cellulosum]
MRARRCGWGTCWRAASRWTRAPVGPSPSRSCSPARLLSELRHPAIVQFVAQARLARGMLGVDESVALGPATSPW